MANSLATSSREFNQEATKTIMDLPCELHERILTQLANLDYYFLYDLKETSKYFHDLCQNFIERNPKRNYSFSENNNLLVDAATGGFLDDVEFYIEEKKVDLDTANRYGYTALQEASQWGHIEVVKYLISMGANVNATRSRRDHPRSRSVTPLYLAVWKGHVEVAEILIRNGAKTDVIIGGVNLLDLALLTNNPKVISLVVSHGFDINQYNDSGKTPLANAIHSSGGLDKSIKFLLENGADYRKTSGRWLPLHYIPWTIRCSELLLDHVERKEGRKGVVDYINSNDNSQGFTMLHIACRSMSIDAVKLALDRGADPNIRDKEGKKPYDHLPVN